MLESKHIVKLRLDRERLAAHRNMPLPKYVTKPLIGQFTTLSDAVTTSLLGVDIAAFERQLPLARKYGTSLLREDSNNRLIGISTTTSLIKSGNILTKNLIVPQDFLKFNSQLSDHFVIGAFVRGRIADGSLACDDNAIEVAGWVTCDDIQRLQAAYPPPTFHSKLSIIAVPCSSLRPVEELLRRVRAVGV